MNNESQNQDVVIDVDQVSAVLKIRPQIYVKLVVSFTESLEEKLKLFQDALGQNDRERMRMILHEIKGTAGNLRLYNITGPEAVLHVALKAGEDPMILTKHFEILKSEADRLRQTIAKFREP